jgi:hypothetical protein
MVDSEILASINGFSGNRQERLFTGILQQVDGSVCLNARSTRIHHFFTETY